MVGGNAELFFELIQPGNFAITGRRANQALDLAIGLVFKFGSKNVVLGHNPHQRRLDHFHRRRRNHIKIKVESVNPAVEDLINLLDIFLEANSLARLDQVFTTNARMKFRIVQEQVRKFGALLDQVQLGHTFGLALELLNRNAEQLAQYVTRVVEGQRLIEVTGK